MTDAAARDLAGQVARAIGAPQAGARDAISRALVGLAAR
jgi:hypothetical protein